MSNLIRESSLAALREYRAGRTNLMMDNNATPLITMQHFESAFKHTKASVPLDERRKFEYVKELLSVHNKHPLEALRLAREKMNTIVS